MSGAVMGVMFVAMVIGFLGFGRHNMMGDHGKGKQGEETVLYPHGTCADCPSGIFSKNNLEEVI